MVREGLTNESASSFSIGDEKEFIPIFNGTLSPWATQYQTHKFSWVQMNSNHYIINAERPSKLY